MKRGLWLAALLLFVLAAAAIGAVGWLLGHELPALVGQVSVNGETMDVSGLSATHWLLLGLAIAVVLALLAVLLPLILVCAVGLPLLMGALAVLMVLGVVGLLLALLMSPLLLLGWWLWKRAAPGATIGA